MLHSVRCTKFIKFLWLYEHGVLKNPYEYGVPYRYGDICMGMVILRIWVLTYISIPAIYKYVPYLSFNPYSTTITQLGYNNLQWRREGRIPYKLMPRGMYGLGLFICFYLWIYPYEKQGFYVQQERILRVILSLHGHKKCVIFKSVQWKRQWWDFTLTTYVRNWFPKYHLWFSGNIHTASAKNQDKTGGTVLKYHGRTHKTLKILVHCLTGSLSAVQVTR